MLSDRDILIYAAIVYSVWLNGALTFWLGGTALFENLPLVSDRPPQSGPVGLLV